MCFPQANIALFEARCKEKIQQFEDAGSDEEDIWDEKDVTFAPEAQRRPRSAEYKHMHTQRGVCLCNVVLNKLLFLISTSSFSCLCKQTLRQKQMWP